MEVEKYKIKISDKSINPTSKYGQHACNGKCFKIYIVKYQSEFLYVGISKQSINSRFSGSFRAYSKKLENGVSEYNGYSGYKWIGEYLNTGIELDLLIFPFLSAINTNDKEFIEAIEAEIVFKIRTVTKKWPAWQHEIHFHNKSGAMEIAEKIFNIIN